MVPRIVNSYVVSVTVPDITADLGLGLCLSLRSTTFSPHTLSAQVSTQFAFWVRLTWWVGYEFEWLLYEFADAVGERELLQHGPVEMLVGQF
ncbi:unnamed protein product [Prunus armeniaca]|uniref:Uncharacterized protein n=1 Tax=Prunus armeniaca TaxID=36596 RepID=A0A6J5WUR6_PRUAR|nr:unnamed protein product [Prunus armeniaca]